MNSGDAVGAVVRCTLHADVLEISIDSPPVNAIGTAVRRGLWDAIEASDADEAVRAVLITGQGAHFIAGADIREFGLTPHPPSLADVCNRIEACCKPVVALLRGSALGGGLEVALAAHYRLACSDARLGLPEVQLGLMPGAGGTQRLPRLCGAKAALDLMLTGRHVTAKEALTLGLVDRVIETDDAQAAGLDYTRELLAASAGPRRTRDAQGLCDRFASERAVEAALAETTRKARGLFSPGKIVDAVRTAIGMPFEAGLAQERIAFIECMESPQRAGMIHAFFAEREVVKVPEATASRARRVDAVGVVGGGTMGAGIAVAALDVGYSVMMVERDETMVARGRANVEKVYDGLIRRGRMRAEEKAAVMARFAGSTDFGALRESDVVIEAVYEDMDVKKGVFLELDRVCKRDAVLASNTSYLNIESIAAATSRPSDVIGLHFFSPANIMKLLEIVVPSNVRPDVVATAFAFARILHKIPVRAGVCDGFIGNRILTAYRQAVDHMVEDGASPYQIDAAVRGFGFPMGPFEVTDLAGGDIGWATRKRKAAAREPDARYVHIADRICERGWFGQKTGRGWYRYPEGERIGQPDPEVLAIIDEERKKAGITPREFTSEEIIRRCIAAMVNEGANVLREGIALRPLDIDVVFLHGYGFPRHRGGPMMYGDTVGLETILADIQEFAEQDPLFWKPSPLLESLVCEGDGFHSLNKLSEK